MITNKNCEYSIKTYNLLSFVKKCCMVSFSCLLVFSILAYYSEQKLFFGIWMFCVGGAFVVSAVYFLGVLADFESERLNFEEVENG